MNQSDLSDLTIEEQLKIRVFNDAADVLTHNQAIQMLKDINLYYVRKEAVYKQLMGRSW